jgi:hypothetical protein
VLLALEPAAARPVRSALESQPRLAEPLSPELEVAWAVEVEQQRSLAQSELGAV